ncbi:MAG: glycosyltransferase [candidate division WOR-3 bacterium]
MKNGIGKKTLWLVYASRKGGHTYPTYALLSYLKTNYAHLFDARAINLLEHSFWMSSLEIVGRYGDLKFRKLWRFGYKSLRAESKWFLKIWEKSERLLFYFDNIVNTLFKKFPTPDLIVSFQPELNAIADYFKKYFLGQWHTVIIDLCLHGLWVNRAVDFYYVYNEEMKQMLLNKNFNTDQILVSGIPLRSQFYEVITKSPSEIRSQLGIFPNLPTILIIGGLLGTMVNFAEVVSKILNLKYPCQLLVVTGKNIRAQQQLVEIKTKLKLPIYIYGATDNVAPLMWASDFIISKPGSVTIAEALSLGKPMIVVTPEAGSLQEFYFAKLLEEENVGRWARNLYEIPRLVEELLTQKDLFVVLSTNAQKKHGHNLNATRIITENIINVFKKGVINERR